MKNDGLILMKSLVVYFHNDPNTPACIGYEAWLDSLDQGAESLKNIIEKTMMSTYTVPIWIQKTGQAKSF